MATTTNLTAFGNNPSTQTTSTYGTTSPAAGTSESWTVTTASGFPATQTTVPTIGFHIVDPALPSELILVTAVSGTSWTVTRGVEGTTPVAHATGATFYQTVSAGDLGNFKQAPSANFAPTTVTSTTETVLANYTVPIADFVNGATFEVVAFGPYSTGGTATKSVFQLAMYWGGSGAVGSAFTVGSATQLAFFKSGVNTAAITPTTIASTVGASWDINGSITILSSTTATANLNIWWQQAVSVAPALNNTTVNSVASTGISSGTAKTISGSSGPIILTAVWSTASASSITATSPTIYRSA